MTTHSFHPDSHSSGLADGCPRCAEHAEHPWMSLDSENIKALLGRIKTQESPRSKAEARAMERLAKTGWDRP